MVQTVEAVFQNGQLKFKNPLVLTEGMSVRVTITSLDEEDPFADVIGICHSGRVDGAANHDEYLKSKRGP